MARKPSKKAGSEPESAGPKITDQSRKTGLLIKAKRLQLRESQEIFGKRFGVKQTTVGRWELGRRVDQENWPAVAALLERTQDELFIEQGAEGFRPDAGFRSERVPAQMVIIAGESIQGAWLDADEMPPISAMLAGGDHLESSDVLEGLPLIGAVPDPKYRGMRQFAVKVGGTSMNKRIPDGGYVICVPYWEARTAMTDGDMVLAERRRAGQYQTTVKRLRRIGRTWELHPESTDPKWQEPTRLTEGQDSSLTERDTEVATTIEIVGKVIWIGSEP